MLAAEPGLGLEHLIILFSGGDVPTAFPEASLGN
jgi:hypothetical protein